MTGSLWWLGGRGLREYLSVNVKSMIAEGHRDDAIAALDDVCRGLGDITDIGLLGIIAMRYREACATEKEIPVMEKLCHIALQGVGGPENVFVDDDEIALTFADLVELGAAYLRVGRKSEAQATLEEAEKLVAEFEWEMDVDAMIQRQKNVYIVPRKNADNVMSRATPPPAEYKRPVLMQYRGGYVWWP